MDMRSRYQHFHFLGLNLDISFLGGYGNILALHFQVHYFGGVCHIQPCSPASTVFGKQGSIMQMNTPPIFSHSLTIQELSHGILATDL